ncbi:MAG TPA: DinB family protein [Dehalococcoidia bacterium]|nr:DinB family protein [Dehalococcoidia bacterium]
MDLREFARESLERTRKATLTIVVGLSDEELGWQPAPDANHIGFLLFHTFRAQDRYFNRWVGTGLEVWDANGWSQRWRLPEHPGASDAWFVGNSWTTDEVREWAPPPLSELLAYGAEVQASALDVLDSLDLSRLPEVPRPERPEFTIAYYLQQAVIHEAQHQGQIDYIAGLLRAGA